MTDPNIKRKETSKIKVLFWLFLLFLFVLWGIGRFAPSSQTLSLPEAKTPLLPKIELLEARDGVVLMVEEYPERSVINIRLAGEAGWRNISMSDFTTKHPVLSPNGDKVTYLSEKPLPHIVIASLGSDKKRPIEPKKLHPTLSSHTSEIERMLTCPWTRIEWSPNESYIAFFMCKPFTELSRAVVISLNPSQEPEIIWIGDENIAQGDRKLMWLNNSSLMISSVDKDTNSVVVDSIDVNFPYPSPTP